MCCVSVYCTLIDQRLFLLPCVRVVVYLELHNFPKLTFNDYKQLKLKLQAKIRNWNTVLISFGKFGGTTATGCAQLVVTAF